MPPPETLCTIHGDKYPNKPTRAAPGTKGYYIDGMAQSRALGTGRESKCVNQEKYVGYWKEREDEVFRASCGRSRSGVRAGCVNADMGDSDLIRKLQQYQAKVAGSSSYLSCPSLIIIRRQKSQV